MSNVVFMVNLPEHKKPNRNAPYFYSIQSWKHYCDKHTLELFVLDQRIYDESYMNANWHKLFVFELLDANDIKYDKVLIVDSDTIIHPDAPNIFDLIDEDHGFYAVHNSGSYDWLFRSMENYSKFIFGGQWFSFTKYFNSGVMVVDETWKEIFMNIITFYMNNKDVLVSMQETYHVGTDQPVLNFFINGQDYKPVRLLPYEWNMQDMVRREILDLNLTFTKYGWVYHFNSIPSNFKIDQSNTSSPVQQWMQYTFEKLYKK